MYCLQTGSGKTYTMEGPRPPEGGACPPDQKGLITRALEQLFDQIRTIQLESMTAGLEQVTRFDVQVSYLQIYNEHIFDLLVEERLLGPSAGRSCLTTFSEMI